MPLNKLAHGWYVIVNTSQLWDATVFAHNDGVWPQKKQKSRVSPVSLNQIRTHSSL